MQPCLILSSQVPQGISTLSSCSTLHSHQAALKQPNTNLETLLIFYLNFSNLKKRKLVDLEVEQVDLIHFVLSGILIVFHISKQQLISLLLEIE